MSKLTWIPCPRCGCSLEKKFGRYGDFVDCSNFPKCDYTENLLNYSKEEQALLGNGTTSEPHYGECNHCGEYAILDSIGLCESCQEWFDNQ